MRKWKDDLLPVLLEMMQDSTAVVKREVSLLDFSCNISKLLHNDG